MGGKIYDKNVMNVKLCNEESGQVLIEFGMFEIDCTQDQSEEVRNEASACD